MSTSMPYRLPKTVRPGRYELELTPDIEGAKFTGQVGIDVHLEAATSEIVLNAAELEITSVTASWAEAEQATGRASVDADLEQATLHFERELPAGLAHLELSFEGVLNDMLHGFYRSRFTDSAGNEQWLATTQFESTDARRAFPCFDEPEFKATFSVSLVVPEHLSAFSSGSELGTETLDGGLKRVRFAETMKMSTYILAFVVGPMEVSDPVDVDGVPLRVATPPGKQDLADFALQTGAHSLRYLSSYFGIPYPSDKIDHLAIPDFAFGAMENLGCVTYRESALLADEAKASQIELQRIAEVVSHETAHMWFGNLVTMRWWNGIWLNEAFATFMELKATEAFRPEWDVWTSFGGQRAFAYEIDSLSASRPIEVPVGPPAEAEAMFDLLTYQKGGSVLRMLEQYLGEETFRKGIARYLDQHRNANTETTDLWDALEAASGEPVRATMDSWIYQGGHPVLEVQLDGSTLSLSQKRFLYQGASDDTWKVPLTLRASVNGEVTHHRLLLEGPAEIDLGGSPEWVVVNEGSAGFYRVSYSHDLLAKLIAAGLQSILDPLERSALVGDLWAFVVRGDVSLAEWISAVEALGLESDPDVWTAVAGGLATLHGLASDADREPLAERIRSIAGPAFSSVGWDPRGGEQPRAGVARGRLISLLGVYGSDPGIIAEARRRVAASAEDPGVLSPDVLTAAVSVTASAGDEATFEQFKALMLAAATPQDEMRYSMALALFSDPDLLARTLDLSLSDEVRSQDGPFLINRVLSSRHGGLAAWQWVEGHWEEIIERFPRSLISRLLDGTKGLLDPRAIDAADAFLAKPDLEVTGHRVDQLKETLAVHRSMVPRLREELGSVLGA